MKILNNIVIAWFIGIFIVYFVTNRTKWFSTLQKEQKWFYSLGWPMYLPYYLWLRYQDRKQEK